MSVGVAHEVVAEVEARVRGGLEEITTTLHVEPFVEGVREGQVLPADGYPLRSDRSG